MHLLDAPGISLIGFQLNGCDNYQFWVQALSNALLVKTKCVLLMGRVDVMMSRRIGDIGGIVVMQSLKVG